MIFAFFSALQAEDSLAVGIADLIAGEKYSEAENKIQLLADTLTAKYWLGALYITRWNDLRQEEDHLRAEALFSSIKNTDPDSVSTVEQKYYIAQAQGQLAVDLARDGSWLKAVGMSRRSVDILEDILEMDSSFVDAETGIAVYRYWIADRLPFYNWLNLRFSDKEESIGKLRKAAQNGKFGKALALQQLFWIYINEQNYSAADSIYHLFKRRYPQTRLALWLEYFTHAYRDEPGAALDALNRLETAYLRTTPLSRLNLLEIRMKQYEYCCRLFDRNGMLRALKRIESMNPSEDEKKILQSKFERFELLRKECVGRESGKGKNSLHSNE